jgi:glycosyltransferase involved in cell wall biosynthesis
VVPYGIPPLEPSPSADRSTQLLVLLLGSYEARKGQDIFLDAIRQMPAPSPAHTCFRMAGREIESLYLTELKRKAADLLNVELAAALDHPKACAAIAAADVVVCASRDETMPLTLLEAMSLGKAIITTDVGGIGEWLRDGVSALFVRPDNSADLARALERCLAEPHLRTQLGREARRTFRRHFSLERLGRTFRTLIIQAYDDRHP